jgi:hypothetical protein
MTRHWHIIGAASIALWVLDLALRVTWTAWSTTMWQHAAVSAVFGAACLTTGYWVGERTGQ